MRTSIMEKCNVLTLENLNVFGCVLEEAVGKVGLFKSYPLPMLFDELSSN